MKLLCCKDVAPMCNAVFDLCDRKVECRAMSAIRIDDIDALALYQPEDFSPCKRPRVLDLLAL